MAPPGVGSPSSGNNKSHRMVKSRNTFAAPPLACRPKLFCCPVAERNPAHLPRCFVNPGRHLMNNQLRSFLECADDAEYTFPKCEVSHIVEVTTRVLHNDMFSPSHGRLKQQQWNIPTSILPGDPMTTTTPPLDHDDDEGNGMALDEEVSQCSMILYSTYQSMSTRYFITQNSNNVWQAPPHSRHYRETHPEPNQIKTGIERYMEIPPFKTMPYTSESTSGSSNGGIGGARPWIPSCSILLWCTKHNNFYEVHVLS
ncbi:uncharacterized protein Z518_09166 [Rhinocladiella mackenziei CBS 650.93]|uniref:Uncharacterized protein n=1 Tax=Rhinocladiella mackenziei CBS 650.93 TaxID=1442369 RepID=A0A0D2IXZ8_9EURO|nr:uncharacterized protein Z518_09166 [Rhinocladiella mackenziei CBS 650.93]KIX01440.1 hypothetical protein Z518_09166 [Rhinocladiella mackenziei CBS 650.93]